MARALGARAPRRLPRWLFRLVAPYPATFAADSSLRVSNAKAKRELDWTPRYPTFREGVAAMAAERRRRGAARPPDAPVWARRRRRYAAAGGDPDVGAVPAHPARGPGRRRDPQPPVARAGGLHPAGGARDPLVAATRPAGAAPGRGGGAGGDGRHRRPRDPVPRPPAPGAVRGDGPLDRVRPRPLPAQGPARRRLPAGPDARGAVHAGGEGRVLLVPGLPRGPLPDPTEVPGRGAAPRRDPAGTGVPHEGLLLVRPVRRRAARVVRPPPGRLRAGVRPPRRRVRGRLGDVGGDGRLGVGGVPGPVGPRGGHLRPRPRRLRRQRRGGHDAGTATGADRGAAGRPGPPHAGHADDRDPGRLPEPRRPRAHLHPRRHVEERDGEDPGARLGRLGAPRRGRPRRSGDRRAPTRGVARAGRRRPARRAGFHPEPLPGQGLHRTEERWQPTACATWWTHASPRVRRG